MQVVLQDLPDYLLVFCRITSFLLAAPVFSSSRLPAMVKVGLALYISLLVFLGLGSASGTQLDWLYLIAVLREILAGLLLGFTATLYFSAIQMAGVYVDTAIGFSIVSVFNPMTGDQTPVIGSLKYLAATLVFLLLNGHHYLLLAIMRSYTWIPLQTDMLQAFAGGALADFLARSFALVFYLSFQIAAPVIVSLFIVDLSLGILSRVAPQFNLFAVGFPIKIMVGLLIVVTVFSGFIYIFQHLFQLMFDALQNMLQSFA